MIMRGFRYKLRPTAARESCFEQFAGVVRLVYNLALEQRRDWWRHYRNNTGRTISYVSQARELTDLRDRFGWIKDVSQTCQQQALRDLDKAYKNFLAGRAGYPRPRRKGVNDAFRFQGREVTVRRLNARWSEVRLPKIGWVRYRDTRALRGTVKNVTVSRDVQGWFVSFACEIEHAARPNTNPPVGIDRGVRNTLALSTGERYALPDSPRTLEKRKRAAQRVLSRRKRGSGRYRRQLSRVRRLQARMARIRRHWLHVWSRDIADRFGGAVIEDLNVKGMTESARGTRDQPGTHVGVKAALNRSILDQGWHMFETMLDYKLEERGGRLVRVPAPYTSLTCSACGARDHRSRKSQAVFECVACGRRDHADTNAAINILRRNTSSMVVEEVHRLSREAITGRGIAIPENPPAPAGGRC